MDVSTYPWGPDVNSYHPVSDWEAFSKSGATFFAAKATEGENYVDKTFIGHRDGFREHCGSFTLAIWYHFFSLKRNPMKQAEHLADLVGPLGKGETLCCDFEGKAYDGLDPRFVSDNGLRFLEVFYSRLDSLGVVKNVVPFIYTSHRHWVAIGSPVWSRAETMKLWVPRYAPEPKAPKKLPNPWASWSVLQYTDGNSGVHRDVPGVGLCDCNVVAK
jgi:GH25 family lysozyme M1 (1,4-beta-N-acetylmuramidase)